MKKKILVVVFVVLAVPLLFIGWLGIRYLSDKSPDKSFFSPEMKFSHLTIYEWNDREMKMNADVVLLNRLPFAFRADSVEFRLSILDEEVMRNTQRITINLEANDSSTLTLPVAIRLDNLQKLESEARLSGDSVPYRLEAVFYSKVLIWRKRKYVKERKFPMFHLLDIKIGRLKLNSLKHSGAGIKLKLAIRNDNIFPVRIKNTVYKLFVAGKFIGQGSIKRQIDFPAHGTVHIDFPLKVSYEHLWETLHDLMKLKKKTKFDLRLNFELLQDEHSTKNSEILVDRKGELEEVISDED